MPLVQVFIQDHLPYEKNPEDLARELFVICREIVPAGFHSSQGPLTPGSIHFAHHISFGLLDNVLLNLEACDVVDRRNLDNRAGRIRAALKEFYPWLTFAVWAKLVTAGYAGDTADPEFDGDMSMTAAIARANETLSKPLSTDGPAPQDRLCWEPRSR